MVNETLSEIRREKELWKIKGKGNQIVDRFRLIAFFIVFSLQIINDDGKGTIMHGVINKTYMEKFKSIILPRTTIKRFKDNENIPEYSFKFVSTDMLPTRINVETYLSGETLLTLQFLHFHSFTTI
jgi:hypothetical protein